MTGVVHEQSTGLKRRVGAVLDRGAHLYWPWSKAVQRWRWTKLRVATSWQARAKGARVRFDIGTGATIGKRTSFDVIPHTHSSFVVGPRAIIGDELTIQFSGGTVRFGAEALVRNGLRITCRGLVDVGARVYLSYGIFLHCADGLTLADDAFIGEYTCITDSFHIRTPIDVPAFHAPVRTVPTRVGRNVWVGAHAVIAAGVDIGDGAFIGGNAMVTKDVPPFWLAAGVPARLIRELAAEEVVEE